MRLFTQFILRPLVADKIRTATTVLGVALGIAVVVAIQLTNASSVRGFETALETVAGKTTIEVVGTGGVDESLLPSLGWLREFGIASPVIEGNAALVVGDLSFRFALLVEAHRGPVRRTGHDAQPDGVSFGQRAIKAVTAFEIIQFLRRSGAARSGRRTAFTVGLLTLGERLLNRTAGYETGEAKRDERDAHEGQWD